MSDEGNGLDWTFGWPVRAARLLLQQAVLFPIVRLLTPVTVRNSERLRHRQGPVIVVANHVSHLDTPVILKALPGSIRRRLVVAAAKDYFYRNRFLGALVSLSFATFPFDRGDGSRDSLAECQVLLTNGWSLLVFPEGTRTSTGTLGRIRRGVAVMADATGTPVLPMYVHGLADIMPKGTAAPLPGAVVVEAGELINPGPDVEVMRCRIEEALQDLAAHRPDWGTTGANQ